MTVTRRIAGVTTREVAPFSFQSLFAISRLKGDVPEDPYDMSRWSLVRRGRTAYVRYRFHTRSLEMQDLLKKLTRAVPDVSIALVTHCLDDGDFGAFTIAKGRSTGGWLGDDWRTPFWERAARALGMTLEEAYEDDDAEMRAESLMRDEAVRMATGTDRRFDWSGGRVYRDLWDERATFMRDLAAEMKRMEDKSA
jgi:hypothetical protein